MPASSAVPWRSSPVRRHIRRCIMDDQNTTKELEFLPGQLVYVSWRQYKKWPAYIVGANDDLGKTYDVVYFMRGYKGPKLEPNVVSNRIRKSCDFDVDVPSLSTKSSVGKKIRVKWNVGLDAEYFEAKITGYNSVTKEHILFYPDDEITEAVNLAQQIIQVGSPDKSLYPISPTKYNSSRTCKKPAKKGKKRKATKCNKKISFKNVCGDSLPSPNVDSDRRLGAISCENQDFTDFRKWLKHRKRKWKQMRKARKRQKSRTIRASLSGEASVIQPTRSVLFPPGTVCYLQPTRSSDLFWPVIVISEESIKDNDEVYSWYIDTHLPKYNKSILVYCFGSKNFSSSIHGESGLRSWGNGNLHNEDEREREKLHKCRPALLKKYMNAVKEAILQNHKALKDRYFVNISEPNYDYQDKDGENDTISMDDIKSLRCEICHSLYDDAMMLICDKCEKAVHIYCSPYPLPDNFDMLKDDFCCQFCMTPDQLSDKVPEIASPTEAVARRHQLVDMKHEDNTFLYFSSTTKQWVEKSLLYSGDLEAFYSSCHFKRVIIRGQTFGNAIEAEDTECKATNGATYIKRKWRFLNGTYTGVTQFLNYFSSEDILSFERHADTLLNSVGSQQVMPSSKLMESSSNSCSIMKRTKTLDESIHRKRVKLFLGYRYAYGAMKENQQKKSRLFNDVDSLDVAPSLVGKIKQEISSGLKLVPVDFINQAVLNYYMKAGSSLGVHQDDKHLFHRPIISLRLFSDSVLSFNCKGMGMQETPSFFPIEQKVGTITLMEGLASDCMLHCIRSRDINKKSLSIIFRRVTDVAMAEMHQLNKLRERREMLLEDGRENPSLLQVV